MRYDVVACAQSESHIYIHIYCDTPHAQQEAEHEVGAPGGHARLLLAGQRPLHAREKSHAQHVQEAQNGSEVEVGLAHDELLHVIVQCEAHCQATDHDDVQRISFHEAFYNHHFLDVAL